MTTPNNAILLPTPSISVITTAAWPWPDDFRATSRTFVKKIIILTYSGRECDARLALEHGVSAYLLQGCAVDELVATVKAVQSGLTHIDPSMAKKVAEGMFRPKLSTRETQILGLVAEGLLNKTIGAGLGIAEDTVKAHLKAILVKLNAVSRTQAVVLAARRGIIQLG